ncbi:MAG: tyrosine-type recombinase/integrase, partial [Oscillibacter sp.]|nr:tyrosine-type recombinase/integrase [Oscillibacter sp.]
FFCATYCTLSAQLIVPYLPFDRDKPHGLHTLRHTLATRLLEQDIPVQTISEILGHARVGSTKVYLQVDLEGLRKCAYPDM